MHVLLHAHKQMCIGIYVCIYVNEYIYYTHMYGCMQVCVCMYVYMVFEYLGMYNIDTWVYVHASIFYYIFIHICMYVGRHVYKNIYTNINYIYMCICKYVLRHALEYIILYVCTYTHIFQTCIIDVSMYMYIYVTGGCTGTLNELVGSHTKLAIYPALAIHCQKVVIHALLSTRFKGMQVVTYPANIKQLKSYWLKSSPKGLGTCIWINKTHNSFWLCSAPWDAPR